MIMKIPTIIKDVTKGGDTLQLAQSCCVDLDLAREV